MLSDFLSTAFVKTVGEIIDNLVTTEEERGELKLKFLNQQLEALKENNRVELAKLDAEVKLMEAKRDVLLAEAKSDSWITRSWRPLTMLALVIGILMHQLGLDDVVASMVGGHGISDEYIDEYFTLVSIGLGGYVVMRGGEKIAKTWKQTPTRSLRSTDKVPDKTDKSS